MGNCLKTQLKENVNNNNLDFLGKMRIKVEKLATISNVKVQYLRIDSNSTPIKVTVDGNGFFVFNSANLDNPTYQLKKYTIPANSSISVYFANDNYNIYVDKYDVKKITIDSSSSNNIFKFDIDSLQYSSTILEFNSNRSINSIGDIKNFSNKSGLTTIELYFNKVHGTLSELVNVPNLKVLNISGTKIEATTAQLANYPEMLRVFAVNNRLSGDIMSMTGLFKLTTLEVFSNPNLFGSINDFATALNVNRKSGTLLISGANSGLTYNDNPFTTLTITFTENGWSAA